MRSSGPTTPGEERKRDKIYIALDADGCLFNRAYQIARLQDQAELLIQAIKAESKNSEFKLPDIPESKGSEKEIYDALSSHNMALIRQLGDIRLNQPQIQQKIDDTLLRSEEIHKKAGTAGTFDKTGARRNIARDFKASLVDNIRKEFNTKLNADQSKEWDRIQKSNKVLFDYIGRLILDAKHADFVFTIGSNRQSNSIDQYNSISNNSTSIYHALTLICKHFRSNSDTRFTMDETTLADVFSDQPSGSTFSHPEATVECPLDHNKVYLQYLLMHRAAQAGAKAFYLIDDQEKLLTFLGNFNQAHPELIPQKLFTHQVRYPIIQPRTSTTEYRVETQSSTIGNGLVDNQPEDSIRALYESSWRREKLPGLKKDSEEYNEICTHHSLPLRTAPELKPLECPNSALIIEDFKKYLHFRREIKPTLLRQAEEAKPQLLKQGEEVKNLAKKSFKRSVKWGIAAFFSLAIPVFVTIITAPLWLPFAPLVALGLAGAAVISKSCYEKAGEAYDDYQAKNNAYKEIINSTRTAVAQIKKTEESILTAALHEPVSSVTRSTPVPVSAPVLIPAPSLSTYASLGSPTSRLAREAGVIALPPFKFDDETPAPSITFPTPDTPPLSPVNDGTEKRGFTLRGSPTT